MTNYRSRVPQFDPYIQQLPVEAIVQVGMEKQKRYDEGVQKIQQSIDKIAGLEVVKDSEKAYLQSKLNQLGNDLTFVAAGDFSNYQLVNSVDGMAKQIAYDPNIQTAVSSAAKRRKEFEYMEEARKKGELNPSNEYVFKMQDASWVNNPELGQAYNAKYTPYKDVNKKAMESIKALHPKLQEIDIPYVVKSDGTIDYSKVADVMKKNKIEGVTEEQIKQAIFATFDEGDWNQLKIDSQYRFRGLNDDLLITKVENDYKKNRDLAIETLQNLDIQKKLITNPEELDKINEQIEQYKRLLGSDGKQGDLDKEFYENVNEIYNNPDLVKYNLYKDAFVKQYANAFSWKNESSEFVKSPLREQLNWVEDMKFKQQQENRQRYEFSVNKEFKEQELLLKAQEIALKKIELLGDSTNNDWTDLGNPTDNENRAKELYSNHAESIKSQIESNVQSLRKKYTDKEINIMLKDWENAQGVSEKATKVPADAVDLIRSISKDNNYIKSLKNFEIKIRKEAEKEAGVANVINNALKGKTNVTFYSEGKKRTLSPRDIVGVQTNQVLLDYVTPGRPTKKFSYIDPRGLNEDQLAYARAVYGTNGIAKVDKNGRLVANQDRGNFTVTPETRTKLDQVTKPHLQAANEIKNAYLKADKIYNKKLGESANQFVPQIKAVTRGKEGLTPVVISRLTALIRAAKEKGLAADDVYDENIISKFLSGEDKKDTEAFVFRNGDSYEIQITNKSDPSNIQRLKVSKLDIVNKLGAEYVNNKTQESSRLTIGKGNTNLTGDPLEALMQKQFGDFPNIQRLQVTADLVQDLSNPDLFSYSINIKKKDGRYVTFNLSGKNKSQKVGFDQGVRNLNNLTDDILLKKIKEEYPNYDYSKLDY